LGSRGFTPPNSLDFVSTKSIIWLGFFKSDLSKFL